MAVRFATIGTSAIAGQFLDALAVVENAEYVAAYSRDMTRAQAFGEPRGAKLFFDDLDELAGCPEVDVVYVGSPNALHAPQALRMIAGKKHVLVEKPFASNEREAREVFDAARDAGVMALEALRTLHVPAFDLIERTIPELGPVRSATFRFAKVTSRMARHLAGERVNIFDPELSAGALMDIGVYCVEPAIALFGEPSEVRALCVASPVPGVDPNDPHPVIDLSGEALLGYGDKVVSLAYGKVQDDELPSQVAGERATLLWDTTSRPTNLRIHYHEDKGQLFGMETSSTVPLSVEVSELDMAFEVRTLLSAMAGEAEGLARRDRCERVSVSSLRVMDEIRRQVGVSFPADEAR